MSKGIITCTWDDVPHLDEQAKADMLKSYPPFQRDARSKGIPQLGAGAIYPVPESEITVEDFPIPKHWPRAYALDVGWKFTAATWGAKDPDAGVTYLYSVYKRGEVEPAIHAQAIKSRGEWIEGAIDPAARGRSQVDGAKLMEIYAELGLHLTPAMNAVEAGLYDVWELLSAGKLKVFKTCRAYFEEYRLYRRDEKGKVVKTHDHIMDAKRYLVTTGMSLAKVKPLAAADTPENHEGAWF